MHLQGCRQLRKSHASHQQLEELDRAKVESIYRFLSLLARTTSPSSSAHPRLPDDEEIFFSTATHFDPSERSIEYIYGVTPSLANMLHQVCELADHLELYRHHGSLVPTKLRVACDHLAGDLSAWTVDSEPFQLISPDEPIALEIVACQARAFHAAVTILFRRSVRVHLPLLPRHAVDDGGRDPVEAILHDLSRAEDVKDAYYGCRDEGRVVRKRTAPMSWPAFVASCEASSGQERRGWEHWWEQVEEYKVGNFSRQRGVVHKVWAVVDSYAEGAEWRWRDVMQAAGDGVLAI